MIQYDSRILCKDYPMSQFQRITITLTEEHAKAVQSAVASGEYGTTSEVIREALRDWRQRQQDRETARAQLRAEIAEGLADVAAGNVRPWDAKATEEIKNRGREKLRAASSASRIARK
jgi:antitoxin ParD1/3/4